MTDLELTREGNVVLVKNSKDQVIARFGPDHILLLWEENPTGLPIRYDAGLRTTEINWREFQDACIWHYGLTKRRTDQYRPAFLPAPQPSPLEPVSEIQPSEAANATAP